MLQGNHDGSLHTKLKILLCPENHKFSWVLNIDDKIERRLTPSIKKQTYSNLPKEKLKYYSHYEHYRLYSLRQP
ncbi:hypothetical protein COV18_00035 [Candidatus Woesearchaeota archaeon CG10_big_fil_rev_8_21_14_0_10_37_12]|nr:MAG: hypothetical protein COV18_00035 [Candidatus Woesearchaeota archaeon CG10_big_fil_rev_8_21_14_0_10_37_12]